MRDATGAAVVSHLARRLNARNVVCFLVSCGPKPAQKGASYLQFQSSVRRLTQPEDQPFLSIVARR